jgi:hypothetical protein
MVSRDIQQRRSFQRIIKHPPLTIIPSVAWMAVVTGGYIMIPVITAITYNHRYRSNALVKIFSTLPHESTELVLFHWLIKLYSRRNNVRVKTDISVDQTTASHLLTELSQLIVRKIWTNYELRRDDNALVLSQSSLLALRTSLQTALRILQTSMFSVFTALDTANGRPIASTNVGRVIVYADNVCSFTQSRQILGQYVDNTMTASFRTI